MAALVPEAGSSAIPIETDYFEDEAPAESESALDLPAIFAAARRRQKAFLITALLALPFGLALPFTANPTYSASSTVSLEQTPGVLDFGAEVVTEYGGTRRNPLAGTMTVILSDAVLGRVVDRLPGAPPSEPSALGRVRRAIKERVAALLGEADTESVVAPGVERFGRIVALRSTIRVGEVVGGGVLRITAESPDAARAVRTANAVSTAFVEYERSRIEEASRSALNWLNVKAAELRAQILGRDEALRNLVSEAGGVPVPKAPGDGGEGDERRALLEAQLQAASLDLLANEYRVAEIRSKLPSGRSGAQGDKDAEVAELREEHADARQVLERARLLYTGNHPELQRLERVVADLRARLPEGQPEGVDETALAREKQLQALDDEASQLRARVRVLEQALGKLGTDAPADTSVAARYERLQREATIDREMLGMIEKRLGTTLLSVARDSARARVLDPAIIPSVQENRRAILLVLGIAAALGAGLAVAVLLELRDRNEYDVNRAARALNVPLLALVPKMEGAVSPERHGVSDTQTPAGESFRNLRTSLLYSSGGRRLRSLVVGSAAAGDGKSTVSVNLAGSIRRSGRRILLIDADLRRPRLDRMLELRRSPGLAEVLQGEAKLEDVVQMTDWGGEVLTSGSLPPNPSELLSSQAFDQLLAQASTEYDLLIFDAPILLGVADTLLIAARVDGVLIVAKAGTVDRRAFGEMATSLARVGATVVGMVANQVPTRDSYAYPSYLRSPYISDADS